MRRAAERGIARQASFLSAVSCFSCDHHQRCLARHIFLRGISLLERRRNHTVETDAGLAVSFHSPSCFDSVCIIRKDLATVTPRKNTLVGNDSASAWAKNAACTCLEGKIADVPKRGYGLTKDHSFQRDGGDCPIISPLRASPLLAIGAAGPIVSNLFNFLSRRAKFRLVSTCKRCHVVLPLLPHLFELIF